MPAQHRFACVLQRHMVYKCVTLMATIGKNATVTIAAPVVALGLVVVQDLAVDLVAVTPVLEVAPVVDLAVDLAVDQEAALVVVLGKIRVLKTQDLKKIRVLGQEVAPVVAPQKQSPIGIFHGIQTTMTG